MAENKDTGVVRDFSRVVISLDNLILPSERLECTPSMQDGLDRESEIDLRILGCDLIQSSGILLKLPQVAMATGQVLYQRFYYAKSFVKHNMEVLAMACINVASKIEECPRRIRDVINVFHHIKQIKGGKLILPLILDQHYINLKNQVIKAERRILKELGFSVHVQHPHKLIVLMLQQLECERSGGITRCAWNYMNDSFRTDLFVRYSPVTIACSCIFLAARQLQLPLPNKPAWYLVFGANEDDIKDVAITILKLYARPKPSLASLERLVNEAKKVQIEHKLKAKSMNHSEFGTPTSTSRQGSPKNVSPNPALVNVKKPIRNDSDRSPETTNAKRKPSPGIRSDHSRSSSRSESRSPVRRSPVRRIKKHRSPEKLRSSKGHRNRSPPAPRHNSKNKHSKKRRRSLTPDVAALKKNKKRNRNADARPAYSPDRASHKHRNGQRDVESLPTSKYRR